MRWSYTKLLLNHSCPIVADWLLPTVSSNCLKVTKHKETRSGGRYVGQRLRVKGIVLNPRFRVLPTFPRHACSLVFQGSLLGEGLEWDLRTPGTTSLLYCYVFSEKEKTNWSVWGKKWVKVSATLSLWSFRTSSALQLFWNTPDIQMDFLMRRRSYSDRCTASSIWLRSKPWKGASLALTVLGGSRSDGLSTNTGAEPVEVLLPCTVREEQAFCSRRGDSSLALSERTMSSGHQWILAHSESCWAPVSKKPRGKKKFWRFRVSPLLLLFYYYYFCLK